MAGRDRRGKAFGRGSKAMKGGVEVVGVRPLSCCVIGQCQRRVHSLGEVVQVFMSAIGMHLCWSSFYQLGAFCSAVMFQVLTVRSK